MLLNQLSYFINQQVKNINQVKVICQLLINCSDVKKLKVLPFVLQFMFSNMYHMTVKQVHTMHQSNIWKVVSTIKHVPQQTMLLVGYAKSPFVFPLGD